MRIDELLLATVAVRFATAIGFATYTEIREGSDNSEAIAYRPLGRSDTLFLYIQIIAGWDHVQVSDDFKTPAQNYGSNGVSVIPRVRYGNPDGSVITEPSDRALILDDVETWAGVFSEVIRGPFCQAQGTDDSSANLDVKRQVVEALGQGSGHKVALRYPRDHQALFPGDRGVTLHNDCVFSGGPDGYDGGTFPAGGPPDLGRLHQAVASGNTYGGEGCNQAGDSTYGWSDWADLCGSDGLVPYINEFQIAYMNSVPWLIVYGDRTSHESHNAALTRYAMSETQHMRQLCLNHTSDIEVLAESALVGVAYRKGYSRDLAPVDADGNPVSMWSEDKHRAEDDSEEDSADSEEDSEEESDDEAGPSGSQKQELSREERRQAKKAQKEAAIAKKKKGAVQVGDMPSDSEEESGDNMPANPNHTKSARKQTMAQPGAEGEVEKATEGIKNLSTMSRRERESLEAAQAKERYRKLHEAGKTDEAKADLARLRLIREKREAEAARKMAEKEEQEELQRAKRAEIEAREAKKREAALGKPANQYRYNPLPTTAKLIRLLTIYPGSRTDDVHIELQGTPVDLDDEHLAFYEALSYTWGSEDDSVMVKFGPDGRLRYSVTRNLADALPYLRYPDRARTIWIDAICIDQKNEAEKSIQVAMMGEVFHKTSRVVAWLGLETDTTRRAIDLFEEIGSQVDIVGWSTGTLRPTPAAHDRTLGDRSLPLRATSDDIRAIKDIFERPWFRRLWVRQEVNLARSAHVQVGFSFSAARIR
ncbi:hypothetical protein DL762_004234 [Monosporascus cannonballus]|uniref:Heterokaryon incompatibility domain-containing protein n=1 Tax=Monosporascus cannonballus TaxID=155416 RepID=A0ABY0H8B1_9PEZI|nr:hypothetical protein DL762_004234 [Monosporascus cannonballus]RYP00622.1 hypothetical protein DL763_000676 [Monosporascus cannonballus]